MKLYEIARDYEAFIAAMEAGEIPEEAVEDTLEAIEGSFEDKADNLACIIKSIRAEAVAMKAEEDALTQRRKAKETRADTLKAYLSQSMERLGKSKLETARNVLSFRKSTGLYIADEEEFKRIHRDLCKETVTISKIEITQIIKAGAEIPGAELRENRSLQIK